MNQQESITRIARRYPRIIRWSDEDNCYIGTLPDICGDCCDAPTAAEVATTLDIIAEDWVETSLAEGIPLPEPKRTLVTANSFNGPHTPAAIKRLREYRNLTQVQLAELLGCSPSTLIKWENGIRRPSGAAARLLAVLEAHPELVYGTELSPT